MIIFLYGKNTYLSREKLREIISRHQEIHKTGFNLKFFDGKNLIFSDFKTDFQTVSMFKEKKLLVVENVFANKNFKEMFLEKAKALVDSKDTILFYEAGDAPKDKFSEILKKLGQFQEFAFLTGEKLKKWAEKELAGLGGKIEETALEKLLDFTGGDSWQTSNEIKKLVSYKKKKIIRACDVELLVKPQIESDVFATVDAIAQRNGRKAIFLLRRHLEKGDSAHYLFSMINFQFRNLIIVKDLVEKGRPFYALAKEAKLHPFVAKKSYYQAQKFTIQELKKIHQKLFKADLDIKTGKIEPETALDLLVAGI